MFKFIRIENGFRCEYHFNHDYKAYIVSVEDEIKGGLTKEDKDVMQEACLLKRDEFVDKQYGNVL